MIERPLKGYRKLIVYQRMMEFVLLTYRLTEILPKQERYGIISQMRRAAVSVISNFVEGYLKRSLKEKNIYLERSMTSLHETDTQGEICRNLNFWNEHDYTTFSHKTAEVGYLLYQYRSKVRK